MRVEICIVNPIIVMAMLESLIALYQNWETRICGSPLAFPYLIDSPDLLLLTIQLLETTR